MTDYPPPPGDPRWSGPDGREEQWRDAAYAWDETLTRGVPSRRVWAWLVDLVLLGALAGIAWCVLLLFGLLTLGLGLPLLGLLPLIPLVYTVAFVIGPLAATPGQALFGLRVVRDEDLGSPTLPQALIWTIGFYVTMAAGAIWLVFALLTVRRRTLHDIVSGLVVVRGRALTGMPSGWSMAAGYHRA